MAREISSSEDAAESFRRWLSDLQVGSLRPTDVTTRRGVDSDGVQAWYFEVQLPNPAVDETWNIEDIDALQLRARDEAIRSGLEWPWYLRFRPVSERDPEEPVHEPAA